MNMNMTDGARELYDLYQAYIPENADIPGSGENGRISKSDMQAYLAPLLADSPDTASPSPLSVKVKRLHKDAVLPAYMSAGASGADLATVRGMSIAPGDAVRVPLGFAVEIPLGYEMVIRPRSGLATRTLALIPNSPGTIDSDYRGEVSVTLFNAGRKTIDLVSGQRIAQAVIRPAPQVPFLEVDELSETSRGEGGHGSTGD